MAARPHFEDLKRRYREADWVSEYQRLWAIFNHWLFAETGQTTDRTCVDMLKSHLQLGTWVESVVRQSAYNAPHRVTDGYGGSYPRFATNNEISRFFHAAEASPILAPRINWPWRAGTEPRVRQSHAMALMQDHFRDAYDAHARVLASPSGMVFDKTLYQVLPALGVGATGCCFFRIPVPFGITPATSALAQMTLAEFRNVGSLANLVNMIDSATPTTLSEDVVETLYNLRNVAMHGALDFLIAQDNAAARAGYDVLDSLIRDVRDRW
jgi:hypothetical protein